jgi:hypothetical protein
VFGRLSDRYSEPTPWFDYGLHKGRVASEDVIFAARCAAVGVPVYVETTARVGHRKVHTFEAPVPRAALV